MDNYDFEIAAANMGCQVTIFDPQADEEELLEKHQNFKVFPYRIGTEDSLVMRRGNTLHEWRRMSSILDKIVIQNRGYYVDYLKLDVGGDEVNFLQDITSKRSRILARFKQINIKVNFGIRGTASWRDVKRYYKYFVSLERKGYRLFSVTVDPVQHKRYYLENEDRLAYSHYDLVWGKCE